jgi:hypothetical protein
MKLFEIVGLSEDGGTVSGGIAPVVMPLGGMISRNSNSFFNGAKYSTDSTPNTPDSYKQYKRKRNAK